LEARGGEKSERMMLTFAAQYSAPGPRRRLLPLRSRADKRAGICVSGRRTRAALFMRNSLGDECGETGRASENAVAFSVAVSQALVPYAARAEDAADVVENTKSLGITGVVFFLTFWGIVSFVKGSTKARIEQRNYTVASDPSSIASESAKHFLGRAYRINRDADPRPGVVTFEGDVAPSVFLAVLLVCSLAAGFSGLVVILNTVLPESYHSSLWWNLLWLSFPVGPWYWSGASRVEQVKMMIEQDNQDPTANTVYIKGHRDELAEFEKALGYKRNEQPA